ncbi:MAG: ABC transporter ATP-binding protein [candidate division KSB1 bacterium]|nr:ABC transporter ATP-binding protein [candidate division KSB1 bacterium]
MAQQKPVLVASNLHKSYPMGRGSLHVLKGIDLEVMEGEIVAVVGPSGVGKSTLLHILGALDRPSEGRVFIDGQDVFALDDRALAEFRNRRAGFVFQFHHLLPELTALENVILPGMIAGYPRRELEDVGMTLLAEVGLENRAGHRPSELSGGEQQRVAVARALINRPQLVLADEPSGNLDLQSSRALNALMWELSRKHNRTLIIVTHNLELARQADRVVELYDGRIKNNTVARRP